MKKNYSIWKHEPIGIKSADKINRNEYELFNPDNYGDTSADKNHERNIKNQKYEDRISGVFKNILSSIIVNCEKSNVFHLSWGKEVRGPITSLFITHWKAELVQQGKKKD